MTTTSRARITETDAVYLAHIARYPASDAEALSYLTLTQPNNFGAPIGRLPSIQAVRNRMTKLEKLGCLHKFASPFTRVLHYGITDLGVEAARSYGHTITAHRSIAGLSTSRLEHYRNVALIAAEFSSPIPQFDDVLGIDTIPSAQVVSEHEIRTAYEKDEHALRALRKKGEAAATFHNHRTHLWETRTKQAQAGELAWNALIRDTPQLLTISNPPKSTEKTVHIPDLVIRLDDTKRADEKPKNWLVEVELSHKSLDEYERILRALKIDMARGITYERALYFCGTDSIARLIKTADKKTNLIPSGRLSLHAIEGRTPHEAKLRERVVVPPAPSPVVPAPPAPPALTLPTTDAAVPNQRGRNTSVPRASQPIVRDAR